MINVEFSTKELFPSSSAYAKIKLSQFFKESSYTEIPILDKNAMLIDITGEIIKPVKKLNSKEFFTTNKNDLRDFLPKEKPTTLSVENANASKKNEANIIN